MNDEKRKISELEDEVRDLNLEVNRLKKLLKDKDKKISELTELAFPDE